MKTALVLVAISTTLISTGCFDNNGCNNLLIEAMKTQDRQTAADKAHDLIEDTVCYKEIKDGMEAIGQPESECPIGLKNFDITPYIYRGSEQGRVPVKLIDGNIERIGSSSNIKPAFSIYDGAGAYIPAKYRYWSYQGKRWDDDLSMWKVMWKLKVGECKGREVKEAHEVRQRLANGSIRNPNPTRTTSTSTTTNKEEDKPDLIEGTEVPPSQ